MKTKNRKEILIFLIPIEIMKKKSRHNNTLSTQRDYHPCENIEFHFEHFIWHCSATFWQIRYFNIISSVKLERLLIYDDFDDVMKIVEFSCYSVRTILPENFVEFFFRYSAFMVSYFYNELLTCCHILNNYW